MTNAIVSALLTAVAWTQIGVAAAADGVPPRASAVLVDWQYPDSLPPRFRNHCSTEYFTGRPYCADRCGSDYQFFYCSEGAFGCCHLGRGYCDIHGLLRCSP
jgi:hypothetical protein